MYECSTVVGWLICMSIIRFKYYFSTSVIEMDTVWLPYDFYTIFIWFITDCPDVRISLCTSSLSEAYVKKYCSDPKFHHVQHLPREGPLPTPVLDKDKPVTSPEKHKELSKTKPKKYVENALIVSSETCKEV